MDGAAIALLPPGLDTPTNAMRGSARFRMAGNGTQSRLADLDQRAPLRVLVPAAPDDPLPLAVLVNTAGGLVGGDHLETAVSIDSGAAAVVTGQAAEKVYRSAGPETLVETRLSVGAGGWLEWLPQATILFDGCRLRRRTALDLAAGARAMAGEILVFGRIARGERIRNGYLNDRWQIRRAGRLVWADALRLDSDVAQILSNPMCFGGALAYGTMIYAADDAPALLDRVRAVLAGREAGVDAAATAISSLVVARWLSAHPDRLRRSFGQAWAALRQEAAGLPPALPRIWHV